MLASSGSLSPSQPIGMEEEEAARRLHESTATAESQSGPRL